MVEGALRAPGGAGDDFHVNAEVGGVLDEVLAAAAVNPHLADAAMIGGDLVERAGGRPAIESYTPAAVTSTASRSPITSITMFRFLPTIFFTTSVPWP
ncbi:hypothetical protein ACWD4T_46865 [Streptomyces umbrinus]